MNKYLSTFAFVLSLAGTKVAADNCSVNVDSDDNMRFDTKLVVIPKACEEFTVHLTHSGKMPVNIMGHNWVLSKKIDAINIAREGRWAKLENDYIKPGDERVIAYTKMIGGGESTSVSFSTAQLSPDEKYGFFCSFPGHIGLMLGTVRVE